MAISTLVQQLRRRRNLDFWGCFVGRVDMFMRDRLHLRVQQCFWINSREQSTVAWVASKIFFVANIF